MGTLAMLITMLLLMTVGVLLAAAATGPGGVGLARVLAGSGAVTLIVMEGEVVSERFPGRSFMLVMGLLTGAFPVGAGLAGLTHDPVVRLWGWPGMFEVGAGIAAVAAGLFLLTCGKPRVAGHARWALPSRHECVLVIVAGLIWTAYN